jgi:hypothetical protein
VSRGGRGDPLWLRLSADPADSVHMDFERGTLSGPDRDDTIRAAVALALALRSSADERSGVRVVCAVCGLAQADLAAAHVVQVRDDDGWREVALSDAPGAHLFRLDEQLDAFPA